MEFPSVKVLRLGGFASTRIEQRFNCPDLSTGRLREINLIIERKFLKNFCWRVVRDLRSRLVDSGNFLVVVIFCQLSFSRWEELVRD